MAYTQKILDDIQRCICQIRTKFRDDLIEDKDKLVFLMNNQNSIKNMDIILDDIINNPKNSYEEDFINKARHLKRQFIEIKENDIKQMLSLKKDDYIDADYKEVPKKISNQNIDNDDNNCTKTKYVLIYQGKVLYEQLTKEELQINIQSLLQNNKVNINEIQIIEGGKFLDVKVNYNVEYVEHTL